MLKMRVRIPPLVPMTTEQAISIIEERIKAAKIERKIARQNWKIQRNPEIFLAILAYVGKYFKV